MMLFISIEDENLYESTDRSYESLFLTGSTIATAEELAAAEVLKNQFDDNLATSREEFENRLAQNAAASQKAGSSEANMDKSNLPDTPALKSSISVFFAR